jgi:hypothetical protein
LATAASIVTSMPCAYSSRAAGVMFAIPQYVWRPIANAAALPEIPRLNQHQGNQYVVFAIGGQQYGAEFVAFALP